MNKSVWGIYKSAYPIPMPPNLQFKTKQDYLDFLNLPEISTPGALAWYRVVLPLDALAEHGWKTDHRFGYPYPRDEDWDLVVIQQADNPVGLDMLNMLVSEGNQLIYETDDNIFAAGGNKFEFSPEMYEGLTHDAMKDSALKAMDMASLITVTTPVLAKAMYELTGHPNIKVLPNYVPEALLRLQRNTNRRKLTIGWQGGHSHKYDLDLIVNPVNNVLRRHKKAEFHVMGKCEDKFTAVRHTPWMLVDRSYKYYRSIDFDIMLIPLLEDEFNRSKSPIKAIEAMALGIPVICSDHEVYRGTVIDGVTGFLVQPDEFEDKLELLANDDELRWSMGKNARAIAQNYTIEGNWDKWDAVYKEIL
jgi:glycosyltransferase involved in cell wall biosynthesis